MAQQGPGMRGRGARGGRVAIRIGRGGGRGGGRGAPPGGIPGGPPPAADPVPGAVAAAGAGGPADPAAARGVRRRHRDYGGPAEVRMKTISQRWDLPKWKAVACSFDSEFGFGIFEPAGPPEPIVVGQGERIDPEVDRLIQEVMPANDAYAQRAGDSLRLRRVLVNAFSDGAEGQRILSECVPVMIVVGEQSSGKTSTICTAGMCPISFTKGATATRCPVFTTVEPMKDDLVQVPIVDIIDNTRNEVLTHRGKSLEEALDILKNIHGDIGRTPAGFTSRKVSVTVKMPKRYNILPLMFLDLPGLVGAAAGRDKQATIYDMSEEIIRDYVLNPRSSSELFICHPLSSDFELGNWVPLLRGEDGAEVDLSRVHILLTKGDLAEARIRGRTEGNARDAGHAHRPQVSDLTEALWGDYVRRPIPGTERFQELIPEENIYVSANPILDNCGLIERLRLFAIEIGERPAGRDRAGQARPGAIVVESVRPWVHGIGAHPDAEVAELLRTRFGIKVVRELVLKLQMKGARRLNRLVHGWLSGRIPAIRSRLKLAEARRDSTMAPGAEFEKLLDTALRMQFAAYEGSRLNRVLRPSDFAEEVWELLNEDWNRIQSEGTFKSISDLQIAMNDLCGVFPKSLEENHPELNEFFIKAADPKDEQVVAFLSLLQYTSHLLMGRMLLHTPVQFTLEELARFQAGDPNLHHFDATRHVYLKLTDQFDELKRHIRRHILACVDVLTEESTRLVLGVLEDAMPALEDASVRDDVEELLRVPWERMKEELKNRMDVACDAPKWEFLSTFWEKLVDFKDTPTQDSVRHLVSLVMSQRTELPPSELANLPDEARLNKINKFATEHTIVQLGLLAITFRQLMAGVFGRYLKEIPRWYEDSVKDVFWEKIRQRQVEKLEATIGGGAVGDEDSDSEEPDGEPDLELGDDDDVEIPADDGIPPVPVVDVEDDDGDEDDESEDDSEEAIRKRVAQMTKDDLLISVYGLQDIRDLRVREAKTWSDILRVTKRVLHSIRRHLN